MKKRDLVSPLTARQIGRGGGMGFIGHDPGDPAMPRQAFRWSYEAEFNQWKDTPPYIHIPFDKAEEITVGASAQRQRIVAFQLESTYVGVLRFFGNQCANPSDTQFITFAVVVNGHPIPGYANIIGVKGPTDNPDPLEWPLKGGDIVEVIATNSLAAPISGVAARIKGWVWPILNPADVGDGV